MLGISVQGTRLDMSKQLGFHSMSELRRITYTIQQRTDEELSGALKRICASEPDLSKQAEDPMFNAIVREINRRRDLVKV